MGSGWVKKVVVAIIVIAFVLLALWHHPSEQYVAGRIRIPARGISAEVYTHEEDPIDGMSSLWQGGTVTTDADLSGVQVGDFAHIYTTEGEHLVLECIRIRTGFPWFIRPGGDVVVINDRIICRLTRL